MSFSNVERIGRARDLKIFGIFFLFSASKDHLPPKGLPSISIKMFNFSLANR